MSTLSSSFIRTGAIFAVAAVTAMAGNGGGAAAQSRGPWSDQERASVASEDPGGATSWGGRLKLSENGLARSRARSRDEEGSLVVRRGRGKTGPLVENSYLMTPGAWGLWPDDPERFGWGLGDPRSRTATPSAEEGFGGLITYYTPRFEGLQFEGSYSSRFMRDDSIARNSTSGTYLGGILLGASLDREPDQFGFGVAVGYFAADSSDDAANPEMAAWNVGFRIDFEGLQFDGAYKKQDDQRGDETGTLKFGSGAAWHIGARYRWGSNGISLSYSRIENEPITDAPGDEGKDAARLSYNRDLGPGVKWSVNGFWADSTGARTGGADDNDGMALATSIRLSF